MKKTLLILIVVFISLTTFAKEGVYLEFKITSKLMNGTSKTYSADGNVRSEMTMMNDRMPQPMTVATLKLQSEPNNIYSINEKDKTYSVTTAGKSEPNKEEDYEVQVIGKETINNYNCVHVYIIYKKSQVKNEMWLSKDIPGYASYTTVEDKYLGGASFFKKLKDKGADGFVVRMLINGGRNEQIQMDLVKAEKKNLDVSLFSTAGYKKSEASPFGGGMTAEQMKNMTPEQRQEFIKKMQEKYQKH